jgi:hypothetical protein
VARRQYPGVSGGRPVLPDSPGSSDRSAAMPRKQRLDPLPQPIRHHRRRGYRNRRSNAELTRGAAAGTVVGVLPGRRGGAPIVVGCASRCVVARSVRQRERRRGDAGDRTQPRTVPLPSAPADLDCAAHRGGARHRQQPTPPPVGLLGAVSPRGGRIRCARCGARAHSAHRTSRANSHPRAASARLASRPGDRAVTRPPQRPDAPGTPAAGGHRSRSARRARRLAPPANRELD